MFTSTIKWGEGTRTITQNSVTDLVDWLTNLNDATGQAPDVFNANGELVNYKFTARGRAYLVQN